MAQPEITAHGVDTLIEKLRGDGVAAGRAEAEKLVAEARAQAAQIVADARKQADEMAAQSRQSADRYRAAGEAALETAMRDAVLNMKSTLMAEFAIDMKRMVTDLMAEPDMLKSLILAIAGKARETSGAGANTEVILPERIVTADAIRDNADEIQSGELTKFVLGLTKEMLEEGVTMHAAPGLENGIRARIKDKDLVIDLSDEAVADLLMQHLQPRFRAVLEGVIR